MNGGLQTDPDAGSRVWAPHGLAGRCSLKAVIRAIHASGRARPKPACHVSLRKRWTNRTLPP